MSSRPDTLLFIAAVTACVNPGCKIRPRASDGSTSSPRSAASAEATEGFKRPRAEGVLALAYLLPTKQRVGCQVHVLKEGERLRYAVDLGATKRRRFYPKSDTYWSRPATFAFKKKISRIGFLWWSPGMKDPGSVFRLAKPTAAPSHHELPIEAAKWSFSCVALSEQRGSSLEGVFDEGEPTVTARRSLEAKQLTPAGLQSTLQALVDM